MKSNPTRNVTVVVHSIVALAHVVAEDMLDMMNNIVPHTPLALDSLISMWFDIAQTAISNIEVVTWKYHIAVMVMIDIVEVVRLIEVAVAMMMAAINQCAGCSTNLIVSPQRDLPHRMHGETHQIVVVLVVSKIIRKRKIRTGYYLDRIFDEQKGR